MPRQKFDGVIEAVKYMKDGRIDCVRLYEKRGAIWSDHVLLDRTSLVKELKKGKKFITGQRKPYFGSSFETGLTVQIDQGFISTVGHPGKQDLLTGVSVF